MSVGATEIASALSATISRAVARLRPGVSAQRVTAYCAFEWQLFVAKSRHRVRQAVGLSAEVTQLGGRFARWCGPWARFEDPGIFADASDVRDVGDAGRDGREYPSRPALRRDGARARGLAFLARPRKIREAVRQAKRIAPPSRVVLASSLSSSSAACGVGPVPQATGRWLRR